FTLVLLVFLLGIGIGSRVVARGRLPPARTAAYAALAQAVTAAGASVLFVVFRALPRYIIAIFQVPTLDATERLLAMGGVVGGVGINVVAALVLVWLAARGVPEGSAEHGALQFRVLTAAGLAMLAFVTALAAPHWSTRLIDLGPSIYARAPMNARMVTEFLAHRGSRQLMYAEGWNATVSVWDGITGRTLKVNGKADASDYGDMDTQIMVGLAPVAARPAARTAFVVGYGSGVTARVLSAVPGMQRVRVVEIEPAVLRAARYFLHVNDTVLARPNVSVVVDDARSALQLDSASYDVIASEPSNPWLAGVATLYTPEFFQVVRSRLADDGVFCQWVQ